ncbi:MAG TPA: glycosyltransferase family 2 protein [Candidatus Moranbacteria bacterium]|nr:glycosyltransferase family 2 protein [Candidatus Moranbacteria bacterium]
MNKLPKVFIVILNYNGKNVLIDCLKSVFKIDYPEFQVLVVDNNSGDGSFEAARVAFSKCIFIKNEENVGFSAGNNIGIKYALERAADYIFLLNNDTEVKGDFLSKLVAVAEKTPSVGLVSPIIFKDKSSNVWFSGGKIDWLRMKTKHDKNIFKNTPYNSDLITGCAMLVKAEVFKRIGLLDEDFFLYWEDTDFSYRARKAGFLIVVAPESFVWHMENSNVLNKNKIYWLVISGLIFFKKNTPLWLKPWIMFYVLLRKIKNKLDRKYKKNEIAEMVKKAYDDFKIAGF